MIRHIDGAILTGLGIYMAVLPIHGDYWRFLNPKFKLLTLITGAMVIAAGMALTLRPSRARSRFGTIVFAGFIAVLALGNLGPRQVGAGLDDGSGHGAPRITLDGRDYIKINLGELNYLLDEGKTGAAGQGYVMRGIVLRTEKLDRLGRFALLRSCVFCCVADAVAMGFRVQYPRVAELKSGEWVQVFGTPRKMPPNTPAPDLNIKGIIFTSVNGSFMIQPEMVARILPPRIPHMFEFRDNEPYAF